ncbi:2Fe-2S iron-sulfur cluster binding domain-containing protein [bacterium]|nr:2Fe-2S iron-sulfur cluster binding domain-containing protein [bacterium]
MSDKEVYTVRIEPVGIEMEVWEDETVLDAAFRQGVALMHGCKEGQCGSCKAVLTEGDVYDDIELLKYSTFALPDMEREANHVLLCRTQLFSDVTIELLNYDEDLLSRSIPVAMSSGKVESVSSLTHDIVQLQIDIDKPLKFWAGQYVDICINGKSVTRAYSMANAPDESSTHLSFIIKKYADGAFSSLLDEQMLEGADVTVNGPFGTCFRREEHTGTLVLVGGGSGMSPLWSILHDQLRDNPARKILFFYGARGKEDLFFLDEFAELMNRHDNLTFIPALSEADEADGWDGETGFIHEVVARHLGALDLDDDSDAFSCGPPPMIDAVLPVFQMNGIDSDRIYFDKFTASVAAEVPLISSTAKPSSNGLVLEPP